jgi:hypothetical protein
MYPSLVPAGSSLPQTVSTPILDRLAPLPARASPWKNSSTILVGIWIMVGIGLLLWRPSIGSIRSWMFAHLNRMSPGLPLGPRVILIAGVFLLCGAISVTIHELGHVLAGLAAGFRFESLVVGPFRLDRSFRISLHGIPVAFRAGWADLYPAGRALPQLRLMTMVLAGPAANFLTASAVFLSPLFAMPYSLVFVGVSVLEGLLDLMPYRSQTSPSDGWVVGKALTNRPWAERCLALMQLRAENARAVMPESFSADALAAAVAYKDDSEDTIYAHAFAYSAAFHQHNDSEAGAALEACLRYSAYAPTALRQALISDAAVFQGRRRRQPDLARQWLSTLPSSLNTWLRWRAEAALCEAQQDYAGALTKLEMCEKAIQGWPSPARESVMRTVARWQSELRQHVTQRDL